MNKTALEILERKQDLPILIVDKTGNIGEGLSDELKNESLVVFVSEKSPKPSNNIIHIPYLKKIPTIPDNTYSHIFLIDEKASLTKEVLNVFSDKAEKDNALLLIVVNKRSMSGKLDQEINFSYRKTKLVMVGDIFSGDYIYDHSTLINKFIKQIKTEKKILIPGDGTGNTYPVYIEDVTNGILEIVFGDKKENIFYLFPKHGVAPLTLAHMFLKKNPGIRMDFVREEKSVQENYILPREGNYLLGESYNLSDRINKLDLEKVQINEELSQEVYSEVKSKRKRAFGLSALISALLLFLVLPLASTLIASFIGLNSLQKVRSDIENNDFSNSRISAVLAFQNFTFAKKASGVILYEANIFGKGNLVTPLIKNIDLGLNTSNASLSLIDASDKIKSVITGNSKDPASDFSSASVELKNALSIYEKEKEAGLIPEKINNKLSDLMNLSSSTVDFWPNLLGINKQRKYVVLFQNNMELRPGGGFIGSYGIVDVLSGKVKDFKIYDVYDADGQLTTHIEPPYPIRRYLPSVHWYLRDSNFDVDFSKGAVASAVFLNTEMREQVDGVIGVDLTFVKNLLSVVGPVNVVDYNQTVNADNFFQIAQAHAEKDFFPGSTQKKDFLRSFFNSLQIKISQEKDISYLNLLQVLSSSIYEKHIIFALNNSNEEAAFMINGWSSSLADGRPKSDSEFNDFLGINEANLGVDKVNYYITRSVSQNITVQPDGTLTESMVTAFKNTAPKGVWTGDGYKNYFRVILPFGASLKKITIDGKEQKIVPAITDPAVYEKKGFIPPSGLEVDKQDEGENTAYGFLINVGPGELRTIRTEYSLSQKINLSSPDINYSLRLFKQPGVDSYPYDLIFNFPAKFTVSDASPDVKISGQKAILSGNITRDKEVVIHLAAK